MESHDPWRSGERTEHEHDASILRKVRSGLDAATREIKICNFIRSEHTKGIHSFRRAIEQTFRGQRGRRDEKYPLPSYPVGYLRGDLLEYLSHCSFYCRLTGQFSSRARYRSRTTSTRHPLTDIPVLRRDSPGT